MLAYVKRTTVKIPDALDARLRHEAERRGTTIAEISREAIEAHLGRPGRPSGGSGAAGTGRSGRSDISESASRRSWPREVPDSPARRRRAAVRLRRCRRRLPRRVHWNCSKPILVRCIVPDPRLSGGRLFIGTRLGTETEVRFSGDSPAAQLIAANTSLLRTGSGSPNSSRSMAISHWERWMAPSSLPQNVWRSRSGDSRSTPLHRRAPQPYRRSDSPSLNRKNRDITFLPAAPLTTLTPPILGREYGRRLFLILIHHLGGGWDYVQFAWLRSDSRIG